MRNFTHAGTYVVFILISNYSFAAESLLSIYQKAITNDPAFIQQQYTLEADNEFITQARSQLRPQINLTLGTGRVNDDVDAQIESASGDVNYDNDNASIVLSQTLWDKTQFENLKLAKNQVQLSQLQLEDSRQDLFRRISDRYFNLLAAEDALEVTIKEQETLKEQFDQASDLLEAGLGTSTDLFQSESRYQLSQVDILTAKNSIADNRQALAEIIGESVQELAKPSGNYPITNPDPPAVDQWVDISYKQNFAVAIAQQQAQIAFKNIDIARSGHWPKLSLNAQQSYNDNDDGIIGAIESEQSIISLDLTAPIYLGGQTTSQSKEANARYRASLKNLDTVSRNIERQIRDAYNTVITSKNQIIALQSAVKAADNALQARQQSFASGLNTNIEVLDATRDLFSSQRDLLQAKYNYITSMFNLKSLAGVLNEADFKKTSDLLTL